MLSHREIKQIEGRLEEVKRAEAVEAKKEARREQGMAKTLPELIEHGKSKGYKNPVFWARKVYASRNKKAVD
jgi:hypothetical protein